jgi:hypothetical protein
MRSRSPLVVSTTWGYVLLLIAAVHMIWLRLNRHDGRWQ